jgi:hypothetical protein
VVVAIAMMQLHTQREYIRKKERAWLERESECALGFGAILLVLTHSGLCNATQRNATEALFLELRVPFSQN